VADLSAFSEGIEIPITGDITGLTTALDDANTELDTFSGKVEKNKGIIQGAGIAATAVGGTIVGGFALATNAAVDFETGMSEVFTLLPGLSADAMGEMSDDVHSFSVEAGRTTDEVMPALYQSISAGVPKENVFTFLETANQAAVGGVTDLETAVDGISSVVNAYGDDVVSATEASDLMFTAVKLGKTNFEELSGSLFNVIPTAAALGVEFGDVTAAISSITAQGTPTSVATTQIRSALVEMSTAGSDASDMFTEVAGVGFKEFIAQGGNLQDALGVMSTAAENHNVAINDLFGSVEAGSAVLALTGKGSEKFASDLEAMGTSTGATSEAFGTMDETSARSMDKIMAMIEDFQLEIGDVFLPILKDDILPALKGLLDMFDGIPDSAKPFIVAVGIIGAGLVIIGPLLVALPAIIGGVGAAFTLLSANPIVLVVGGLILLFVLLQTKFDIIGKAADILGKGFEWLSGTVSDLIDWITDAVDWSDVLGTAFKILLGPIGWVMTAMEHFGVSWDDVWQGMLSIAQRVSGFIVGIFDSIVGTVRTSINWVIDGINTMIRGLNRLSFDVPDWVPGIGGESIGFSLNELPHFADGGIVTEPTLAVVGEAGPEAIVPLSGSNAGGMGSVTINVESMNVRDDQDIKKIATQLYSIIDRKNGARGIR
jgi:TP901 family phage tail tape measure protein